MVDVSDLLGGDFLNSETVSEGDICEVTGEGEKVEIERNGKNKPALNIPVRVQGEDRKDLTYTPGKKGLQALTKSWGADTSQWKNKKFSVKFIHMEVAGKERKVVRPEPISN